jgi:hypothetical protein
MTGKYKSMADFEWAGVCRYIRQVETMADLREVADNAVYSFPIARVGIDKMRRAKERTRSILKTNLQKLETFVGMMKGELTCGERSVLRSHYRQMKSALSTVEYHLEVADKYVEAYQIELMNEEVPNDDSSPF